MLKRVTGVVLAAVIAPCHAATETTLTSITRTLVTDDDRFGGCMVHVDVDLRTDLGLDCDSNWVTFSCNGEHTDATAAQRMFDSAMVAFVTDRKVYVWVTDERKHDNRCYVSRIDVTRHDVEDD